MINLGNSGAITTAADGCKAALEAQRYLESLNA
jgi:thioredoxin reductase